MAESPTNNTLKVNLLSYQNYIMMIISELISFHANSLGGYSCSKQSRPLEHVLAFRVRIKWNMLSELIRKFSIVHYLNANWKNI